MFFSQSEDTMSREFELKKRFFAPHASTSPTVRRNMLKWFADMTYVQMTPPVSKLVLD